MKQSETARRETRATRRRDAALRHRQCLAAPRRHEPVEHGRTPARQKDGFRPHLKNERQKAHPAALATPSCAHRLVRSPPSASFVAPHSRPSSLVDPKSARNAGHPSHCSRQNASRPPAFQTQTAGPGASLPAAAESPAGLGPRSPRTATERAGETTAARRGGESAQVARGAQCRAPARDTRRRHGVCRPAISPPARPAPPRAEGRDRSGGARPRGAQDRGDSQSAAQRPDRGPGDAVRDARGTDPPRARRRGARADLARALANLSRASQIGPPIHAPERLSKRPRRSRQGAASTRVSGLVHASLMPSWRNFARPECPATVADRGRRWRERGAKAAARRDPACFLLAAGVGGREPRTGRPPLRPGWRGGQEPRAPPLPLTPGVFLGSRASARAPKGKRVRPHAWDPSSDASPKRAFWSGPTAFSPLPTRPCSPFPPGRVRLLTPPLLCVRSKLSSAGSAAIAMRCGNLQISFRSFAAGDAPSTRDRLAATARHEPGRRTRTLCAQREPNSNGAAREGGELDPGSPRSLRTLPWS